MLSLLLCASIALVDPQQNREIAAILALNPTACWSASTGYGVDGALRIGYNPEYGYFPNYVRQDDPIFATNHGSWGLCLSFRIDADRGQIQTLASKNREFKLYFDPNVDRIFLTVYGPQNGQQASAASTVPIQIGATYSLCCGFNTETQSAYLQVNAEPTAVAMLEFVPESGTAPLCLGWYEPWATIHALYGTLDSFGWSQSAFSPDDIAILNAGVRWENLPQAQRALFLDWYDFGNSWVHSPDQSEWDWLKSNLSNRSLQPVLVGQASPFVVPGLFAPLQFSNSQTSALWYPDLTGHGHYMLQPWYKLRTGWHAAADRDMPAFWFDGEFIAAPNMMTGHFQPCWSLGSLIAGVNVPWSAVWVYRAQPHLQTSPPEPFLGLTLGGINSHGFVPWRPHGSSYGLVPASSGHSVKYSTSEHYTPIWSPQVNRWVSRRQSDNDARSQIASPNIEAFDFTRWHSAVFVFDGTRSKFWIDGRQVFNAVQTVENASSQNRSLGSMAIRSFSIGGGCYGRDEMIFNPPYPLFSGGGWAWVGWQRIAACWAGSALSDVNAATLSKLINRPNPGTQ